VRKAIGGEGRGIQTVLIKFAELVRRAPLLLKKAQKEEGPGAARGKDKTE